MCCERLKIKRFCYKRVFIDLSKISKNGIARILKIKNKSFMSLSQDEKNNVIPACPSWQAFFFALLPHPCKIDYLINI